MYSTQTVCIRWNELCSVFWKEFFEHSVLVFRVAGDLGKMSNGMWVIREQGKIGGGRGSRVMLLYLGIGSNNGRKSANHMKGTCAVFTFHKWFHQMYAFYIVLKCSPRHVGAHLKGKGIVYYEECKQTWGISSLKLTYHCIELTFFSIYFRLVQNHFFDLICFVHHIKNIKLYTCQSK